jgi:hypothetical protein
MAQLIHAWNSIHDGCSILMKVCPPSSSLLHAMMKIMISSSLGGGGARLEARSKVALQPEVSNRLALPMTSKNNLLSEHVNTCRSPIIMFRIRGLPISGLHDCILRAHNYEDQLWNSEIYSRQYGVLKPYTTTRPCLPRSRI